jgi:hypothetical protein
MLDSTIETLTTITLSESYGIVRNMEPVRFGIPFPKGIIKDPANISFFTENNPIVSQLFPVQHWSDGSLQWVFASLLVTLQPYQTITINVGKTSVPKVSDNHIKYSDQIFNIDCGYNRTLSINRTGLFLPFFSLKSNGTEQSFPWNVFLNDKHRSLLSPLISTCSLEESGPVCSIIKTTGHFGTISSKAAFSARTFVYHAIPLVKIDFQIFNPDPAHHYDNTWDLGDPGSLLFRELTLQLDAKVSQVHFQTDPSDTFRPLADSESLEIIQQSSGGDHWNSSNHINGDNQNYRLVQNGSIKFKQSTQSVPRLQPAVRTIINDIPFQITLKEFWQNFPKAFSIDSGKLKLSLFPDQNNELYELQGGESKIHSIFFTFDSSDLSWIPSPLIPVFNPSWIKKCMVYPFFAEQPERIDDDYNRYIKIIIEGDSSFFKRRELIDEYGWRNFGELYADHESRYNPPDSPFISHYNNQYDFIYWSLIHYLKSCDSKWFTLADQSARHTRDIDIYHTDKDRFEFNGGMFWHTNHYFDARTASHRCYSKYHSKNGAPAPSGGPSPQNCYINGIILHYLLTADHYSYEAALKVCNHILSIIKGPKSIPQSIKYKVKRRLHSLLHKMDSSDPPFGLFEGPGRESANALAVLCAGYTLTKKLDFLVQAERLIRICISPTEHISKRHLEKAETRWSYIMFLQSISNYLFIKEESGNRDRQYDFARHSLIHYVQWMSANETPYLSKADQLEYPNETWAGQEIRKANVFYQAAYHCEDDSLRKDFLEKGEFFFNRAMKDLHTFGDFQYLTRPLVIALGNGLIREYWAQKY